MLWATATSVWTQPKGNPLYSRPSMDQNLTSLVATGRISIHLGFFLLMWSQSKNVPLINGLIGKNVLVTVNWPKYWLVYAGSKESLNQNTKTQWEDFFIHFQCVDRQIHLFSFDQPGGWSKNMYGQLSAVVTTTIVPIMWTSSLFLFHRQLKCLDVQ